MRVEAASNVARAGLTFARHRWGFRFSSREALHRHQARRWQRLARNFARHAPLTAWVSASTPLANVPIVEKSDLRDHPELTFTLPIDASVALETALQAERTRDFSPTVPVQGSAYSREVSVGLSSGTSGRQSLFVLSRQEQMMWAATVIARIVPARMLREIVTPWGKPIRIAFVLRASGHLYESMGVGKLNFAFADLLSPLDELKRRLEEIDPQVLIAPASVLSRLARDAGKAITRIEPNLIVSVAEPLDEQAKGAIRARWSADLREVYQATEGLIALTCSAGELHLLEEQVVVEPEWLPDENGARSRFTPIITDLERTTQLTVRRRLDDVLRAAPGSTERCACGRITRRLAAVEGRLDEVIERPSLTEAGTSPIFPDVLRRAFAVHADGISEWTVVVDDGSWTVNVLPHPGTTLAACDEAARRAVLAACADAGVTVPDMRVEPWRPAAPGEKLVRIRRSVR